MLTTAIQRFRTDCTGSVHLDGISIGAAGVGLVVAAGAALLIGGAGFDYSGGPSGLMGLQTTRPAEPTGPVERRALIEILPTRTATECGPVYDGGPVACSTPITQRCELWQMTDGSTQEVCTRL